MIQSNRMQEAGKRSRFWKSTHDSLINSTNLRSHVVVVRSTMSCYHSTGEQCRNGLWKENEALKYIAVTEGRCLKAKVFITAALRLKSDLHHTSYVAVACGNFPKANGKPLDLTCSSITQKSSSKLHCPKAGMA